MFGYFVAVHVAYLFLDGVAFVTVGRSVHNRDNLATYRRSYGLEPPVSVLVPAFNEAEVIVPTIRALLQLDYPQFEIVVISDGSTDSTVDLLKDEFDLTPCPRLYQSRLDAAPVRGVYISRANPALRVIDKDNGGKADSLNAGLNVAQYPLFCAVDADSILQRDSLLKVISPFVEDPTTVAAGGTVRVLNGSEVSEGFIRRPRLPVNGLARIQVVEYMRAFLFGRVGWSPLKGVLIISGAFGVFRRAEIVDMGGYRVGTVGEDADLVMRLHRYCRAAGRPYRIAFVPDPICWTEAPEDVRSLGRQRIRWQRGLAESLSANRGLVRNPGVAGWVSYPFLVVFECLGPLIELAGYAFVVTATILGLLSVHAMVAFLLLAVALGTVLSLSALLLEERWFRSYSERGALRSLVGAALLENLGFRQLNLVWRAVGLFRFAFGKDTSWGHVRRVAAAS
ncbi:MAG TPA: glycosyltransferase [Mycobacteriales bacterium]|nr:glycosyltransferase [Mycobacteriales bacterium]